MTNTNTIVFFPSSKLPYIVFSTSLTSLHKDELQSGIYVPQVTDFCLSQKAEYFYLLPQLTPNPDTLLGMHYLMTFSEMILLQIYMIDFCDFVFPKLSSGRSK